MKILTLEIFRLCNSYNTGKSAVPDIYARCPRARSVKVLHTVLYRCHIILKVKVLLVFSYTMLQNTSFVAPRDISKQLIHEASSS